MINATSVLKTLCFCSCRYIVTMKYKLGLEKTLYRPEYTKERQLFKSVCVYVQLL